MAQVGGYISGNIANCLFRHRFPSHFVKVGIGTEQLALVIEHLLKVRNMPNGIHGVAVETLADMVVDATGEHLLESNSQHFQCRLGFFGGFVDGRKVLQ